MNSFYATMESKLGLYNVVYVTLGQRQGDKSYILVKSFKTQQGAANMVAELNRNKGVAA